MRDLVPDGYEDLLGSSPQATLFCSTWWLEAVAPGRYRILTAGKGGELQAAWPLVSLPVRYGLPLVGMPPLTPWLGVLYRPGQAQNSWGQLAREKDLALELIGQLPGFARMQVSFHRTFTYWLPFYWRGFEQTTRYTYVIDDLSDLERVWRGIAGNIRRNIAKAGRAGLVVEVADDVAEFARVQRLTFERQGLTPPAPIELLERLDAACSARGVRRILLARDPRGLVHAGVYLVWDRHSAYYLMGGGDPELRASGAADLLLWEAIRFAATVAPAFDFEGSMREPLERFFRAFGARPCPYFTISDRETLAWRARQAVRRGLQPARRLAALLAGRR